MTKFRGENKSTRIAIEILKYSTFPCFIDYSNYPIMFTGNGGSWNRRGSFISKEYKLVAIPYNKKVSEGRWRYICKSEEEHNTLNKFIQNFSVEHFTDIKKGGSIIGLFCLGTRDVICNEKKNFSAKVIKEIKLRDDNMCVYCGSKHSIEVDHKNDKYYSDEILEEKDGQLLCSHCNVMKRGGNSVTRYDRILPPFLQEIDHLCLDNIYIWSDPKKWASNIDKEVYKKISEKDYIIEEQVGIIYDLHKKSSEKDYIIEEQIRMIYDLQKKLSEK
jgi:hypothetical protein